MCYCAGHIRTQKPNAANVCKMAAIRYNQTLQKQWQHFCLQLTRHCIQFWDPLANPLPCETWLPTLTSLKWKKSHNMCTYLPGMPPLQSALIFQTVQLSILMSWRKKVPFKFTLQSIVLSILHTNISQQSSLYSDTKNIINQMYTSY